MLQNLKKDVFRMKLNISKYVECKIRIFDTHSTNVYTSDMLRQFFIKTLSESKNISLFYVVHI